MRSEKPIEQKLIDHAFSEQWAKWAHEQALKASHLHEPVGACRFCGAVIRRGDVMRGHPDVCRPCVLDDATDFAGTDL